ncbi:MAG: FAD-dependent oxidoreductase [Candidatus Thermoplasmatota archaeon]|nr:FAD-dependent oxidoreductase [Candidatus Thermoplasmatota archaeon]
MKYDTIIIGAGFTGMAAAALLSKKQNVLVVDKNIYYGGRSATLTPKKYGWADVDDYYLDFGHHLFPSGNYLDFVIKHTGADKYCDIELINMPMFYRYKDFHKPPTNLLEKLTAYPFMPFSSKLRINKLLKYAEKTSFNEIKDKWLYHSIDELYDHFNFDEYAREIFTDGFVAGYQTVTETDKLSGGDLLFCMKAFQRGIKKYKTPLFASRGGVVNIIKAFSKIVEKNNGKIMLGKKVKKIIVEKNQMKGITLEDNKIIYAKNAIYAAPVYGLLNIVKNDLPDKYIKRLNAAKKESTNLFLVMGGSKKPLLDKPIGTWIMIPKTETKHVDSYYLVYEFDQKLKQAPNGHFLLNFAVEIKDMNDLKNPEELVERMIKDLQPIFPDFNFKKDFEWRVHHFFPIVDGLRRTITWHGKNRFGPNTPIKNLYVAGDSCYEFSTGVDGAVSSAIFTVEKITGEGPIFRNG